MDRKACTKLQGQVTSGANCIAQKATIAAITADVKQISYMVDEFKSRKKLIIELMSEIKGIKSIIQTVHFIFFLIFHIILEKKLMVLK